MLSISTHARAHTDTLFFDNKILKIKDLYCFQLGEFMYNYNSKSLPNIFNDLFHRNNHIHNYPTRRSGEFHLLLLRTIHAQNTFIFTGPRLWNNLDHNIKGAKSLMSFKYWLRKHLLEPYNTHHHCHVASNLHAFGNPDDSAVCSLLYRPSTLSFLIYFCFPFPICTRVVNSLRLVSLSVIVLVLFCLVTP